MTAWPTDGASTARRTRRSTVTAAALLALAAAALGAPPARAAPPVTNTNDTGPGSLRAALAGAVSGDTIGVPAGTYRLSSQLTVGVAVEIDGAGARTTVVDGQGITRAFNVTASGSVTISDLSVVRGRATGSGGAILRTGAGALEIERATILGNVANAGAAASGGGGGVHHGSGPLTIRDTTISENTANADGSGSGGGGLFAAAGGTIRNSTISRNRLNVSGSPAGSGGGGYFVGDGSGLLNNVTLIANATNGPPGGGIYNAGLTGVPASNTILANNAAGSGANCENAVAISSGGNNLDSGTTCGLGGGELSSTNPIIGALEDNGGPTPTHRLFPNSPAIDAGFDPNCEDDDQRGAERPAPNNSECDIGALEFEGLSQASVPNCTRTGQIPFTMFSPPGAAVEGLNFKIDGGPQQQIPLLGGGESASGSILIPEGRRRLEFWADSTPTGDQIGVELIHHFPTVVVDRTNPNVAVRNPNRFQVFVINRRVNVNVSASDSISGLINDPSGANRLSTARRGAQGFAPAAVDLCFNSATAPFNYRVLAPGLGVRTVIEELSGGVRVVPRSGSSARVRASQKGQRFSALREPRELRVGSLIDTRRGTARVTSARSRRETNIQDGEFAAGIFQVLQSRRGSARGLTELRLKGGSFRRCRAARGGGRASAARLSRRAIRRLRSRARGRFRTRGRYSAATVRGTTFEVVDRCDGTLTRVRRGRVAVRDFKRRKTIILRAGKAYLARK
jgi:hypothetical protein